MGWENENVFPLLIITAGGGFTGLFVYSPGPGTGNLIASIAAQAGTDPYGNSFAAGETTYSNVGLPTFALSSQGATLQVFIGPTGPTGPLTALTNLAAGTISFPPASGPFWQFDHSMSIGTHLFGALMFYAPAGAGVDDFANLNALLSGGTSVCLLPGTYLLSAQLTVAGATLMGCDMATVIQPFGGYAGALLGVGSKGAIRNLSVTNGGANAIEVAGGVVDWWLEDLYFASNTGSCIHCTPTGSTHGRIRGIRGASGGSSNGGGIAIDGGSGGAISAQVNISDIDIQNCTAHAVLFLSAVTDILVNSFNGSLSSTSTAPAAVTIEGACQTCHLVGFDVGGNTTKPTMRLIQAGVNSPSDITIQGKLQDGSIGVLVNDATARCNFDVYATRNQGDGIQVNSTGVGLRFSPQFHVNNQAAGVAYDMNVTSTGHVLINSPGYDIGGGVTQNRNITLAGNHVTAVNEPAGTTTAGFAPAGW